jgi:hypothetical protein
MDAGSNLTRSVPGARVSYPGAESRRMAYRGLEEFGPAIARIKTSTESRSGSAEVDVIPSAAVRETLGRPPDPAFVSYDGPRGPKTVTADRLLFAAHNENPALWKSVERALFDEGFIPFGPRAPIGIQVYQSERWASPPL